MRSFMGNMGWSGGYINTDGSEPDGSAILDLKSTEKGLLLPRMTGFKISNITSPANGLIVYNTDDDYLYMYNDAVSEWKKIDFGTGTITTWACGDDIVDTRDSKTYTTVQIGTRCWMKENLNYVTGNSWCYNDNTDNCDTYGRMYDWNTIMNGASSSNSVPSGVQSICPDGWHLPSDAE